MRTHYWQFLVNEEGQPIEGANIYVYLANSTTPAYVFTQNSGGTAVQSYSGGTSSNIIQTDSAGYFEFWIGDESETNGYSSTQKFKLSWTKAGVANGTIDYIDILSGFSGVNESDTDTTKNKLVSNYLAKYWTDGINNIPTLFTDTITTFTASGGLYYSDITHNLGGQGYPLIQFYRSGNGRMVIPENLEFIDVNTIRLFMESNDSLEVVALGEPDSTTIETNPTKSIGFVPFETTTAVTTGSNDVAFTVPASMNNYELVNVVASVTEKGVSGSTDIQVVRRRNGVNANMLSTPVTIDDEYYAQDEGIDTDYDDFSTGDQITINVTSVHSTAPSGLSVTLEVREP